MTGVHSKVATIMKETELGTRCGRRTMYVSCRFIASGSISVMRYNNNPPAPAPPRPGAKPAPRARGQPAPPAEPPTGYDFDLPCYDTGTSRWCGNPAAFAIKNPRSWEAQHYRDGKYPPAADFLPGNEHPDERRSRAPPPPVPTYADAASSSSARRKGKGRAKEPTTAAQVAASSNASPSTKASAPLPAAMRRFYAPRTEPLPHDNALDIAATAPNMMAALLRESARPHQVSFSAAVQA